MAIKEALAFDDVSLVPVYTEVRSRSTPDLSTEIAGIKLRIPLISSPMDTITESRMAIAMGMAGGMGIVHRFMPVGEQIENLREITYVNAAIPRVAAIGIGDDELGRFKELNSSGLLEALLIDVANGHSSYMKEMIQRVQDISPDLKIIAGSIATGEGFRFLAKLGVSAVRCGIGSGSICKTVVQTGFSGVTLQSVFDAAEARRSYSDKNADHIASMNLLYPPKADGSPGWGRASDRGTESELAARDLKEKGYPNVAIIADGGIRYPADMVKALAAGADAVMCGRVFAATDETPGEVIELGPSMAIGHLTCAGIKAKVYRGAASAEIQQDRRGGLKAGTCAEGVSTTITCAGPVEPIISEFCGGLRSGMTYANATNLAELRQNAQFVRVTSNGVAEGHAYGTRKE